MRHLQRHGLKLLARNFRARGGEIDLIMQQARTLVFVEVRYRQSLKFGTPLETVTVSKQRRLIAAAAHYLQTRGVDLPCRFDVVGISGADQERIDWIRDAFQLT